MWPKIGLFLAGMLPVLFAAGWVIVFVDDSDWFFHGLAVFTVLLTGVFVGVAGRRP